MDNPIVPQRRQPVLPDAYHALAASRGMEWLGPYFGTVTSITTWKCSNGHEFRMSYYNLKNPKYGCQVCAHYQPEDYEAAAAERGITWLGPYPPNSRTKTSWRCAEGHEWDIDLHSLRMCNVCAYAQRGENLRHTPDEYHRLAAKFGVTWIGDEVRNTQEKTRWRCNNGHEWLAPYANFRGCTICNYSHRADKRRNTPEEYHALAAERGIVWLGPEVTSSSQKTRWQCPHGHVWETSYGVIRGGCGCRVCSIEARNEKNRRQQNAYIALAAERGFAWVGPEVKSTKYKTTWKCQNGHEWEASFNNVSRGSNCPQCLGYVNGVRVSKPQLRLHEMLGGIANYKIERYSIDVALPQHLIAVEYDCQYWHDSDKTRQLDAKKTARLIDAGWKVLRVKAQSMLPTKDQLDNAIALLLSGETYQEIVLDDWLR